MEMKFQGFHPSDFTLNYLEEKMTTLQEEAPHGARMEARFSRRDRAFKAVVTIFSPAGKFFAVASGKKLREVTQKINHQLHKQLDKWKKRAHRKERLRNVQDINEDFFGIA